jgi:hypothetical protein
MTQNLEQHQLFHDGFESMETYFGQVQKDSSVYDAKKVREIIEAFGTVFCTHLQEEIETLERSKLVAIFPDEKDFQKVWKAQMDWAIGKSSKLTTMPWVSAGHFIVANGKVVTHHDEANAPWFTKHEIPAIVRFLARFIFPWFNYRHSHNIYTV